MEDRKRPLLPLAQGIEAPRELQHRSGARGWAVSYKAIGVDVRDEHVGVDRALPSPSRAAQRVYVGRTDRSEKVTLWPGR